MVGANEQVAYTEASRSTVMTGRLASSTGMVRTSPPALFSVAHRKPPGIDLPDPPP